MKKIKDVIEEDRVPFEAYSCLKCGKELMNMRQLGAVAKKYRALRRAKEIKFAKWGNSIAVRIPSSMVKEFHIVAGKSALMVKEKEGLKIIPA